jgi:ATP-dependent RNA helicase DeaD
MLCRRGHATKGDIGAIRIFDRETRFQIVANAVERFEAASAKDVGDGGRIMRLEDGAGSPNSEGPPPRARPPRDDAKPFVKRADGDKPFKPRDDAKPFDRPREHAKPYAKPREDGPLPRKFKERAPTAGPGWSPVENAAATGDQAKKPYKGKQPHPKSNKKRKPNG